MYGGIGVGKLLRLKLLEEQHRKLKQLAVPLEYAPGAAKIMA